MFETHNHPDHESSLVATFPDRESAHVAVGRLHDEGFHKTWIGLTRSMGSPDSGNLGSGEPRVEEDNSLARFFGGGDESLSGALHRHGVSAEDAAQVDTTLVPGSAILTVHGANHPELAAEIVEECGGTMMTSAGSSKLRDTYSDRSSFAGLGGYGGGSELGEERRLQLRAERLSIDKRQVDAGEAVVGKRVVTEITSVDVPLVHEELFIERRPATGIAAGAVGAVGDGESIHVPLMREELDVKKTTVATEDVVVGQRRVEETARVDENVRHEELDVDNDVANRGTAPLRTDARERL